MSELQMKESHKHNVLFKEDTSVLHTVDGKIRIHSVEPINTASENILVIAPGWSETIPAFDGFQKEMAEQGIITVAYDTFQNKKVDSKSPNSEVELKNTISLVKVIFETKNKYPDKNISILAHSAGTLPAIKAATILDSKIIKALICMAPAGIIGKDTILGLAARFTEKEARFILQGLREKDKRQKMIEMHKESWKYIIEDPVRAYKEIESISKADIIKELIALRRKGMKVGLLYFATDKAFPMKRIENNISVEDNGPFDAVAAAIKREALHDEALVDARSNVRGIADMLKNLNHT